MINPTDLTDAAPPERGSKGLVFLAGAIKYWWLKKCNRCGAILPEDAEVCTNEWPSAQTGKRVICNASTVYELWGGPEHTQYVEWRDRVRRVLIENGYLTYAPHEAFKGTWTDAAQVVNDAAIVAAQVMAVLSPPGIPTEGTDDEVKYAKRVDTPVLYLPPGTDMDHVLHMIRWTEWPSKRACISVSALLQ